MADLRPLMKNRKKMRELERMEGYLVLKARDEGATWREIGEALEISHQAAWERFSMMETEIGVGEAIAALERKAPKSSALYKHQD